MFCQLLNFALNENIFRKLTKFCMIKWCPRQIFLLLQNWKSNEIDYNLPSLCILCPNFFPSGYTSSPHSLNHHSLLMMCWGRSCGSLSWNDNFFITMQKSHQTFYLKHFSNSSLSEWFFKVPSLSWKIGHSPSAIVHMNLLNLSNLLASRPADNFDWDFKFENDEYFY